MNYKEARNYLDTAALKGSVYGLESIKALLEELGNPQEQLKFIHASGTNGKGSTLAFISTILKYAGYRVGRYISPTVICYRERIQINEEYITEEALARLTEKVAKAVEAVEEKHGFRPTAFEIETAISFLYFLENDCDLVALETGLGGLTDATNIVSTTILSVIASISMDHMAILGDNIASIATNKAGIIKPGIPVVSLKQVPEAMEVIIDYAEKQESRLYVADPSLAYDIKAKDLLMSFSYKSAFFELNNLKIGLVGLYQISNATLALEAIGILKSLGYNITENDIRNGLCNTKWIGRFTKIHDNPTIIIDGAHNIDAAFKLRETLDSYFTNKAITYIMGVLKDKEYDKILDIMLPKTNQVVTITPDNSRALDGRELAKLIEARGIPAYYAASVKEALEKAIVLAGNDSTILCFGSLYYLGQVIKDVEEL